MDKHTALLPTNPLDVETWLRSLANPSDLLRMKEAGQSEYPYLFGLATVKLADAHREYLRLLERQAGKSDEALDTLERCAELLDDYSDVTDGDYGEPRPNRAMSLLNDVQAVLNRSGR